MTATLKIKEAHESVRTYAMAGSMRALEAKPRLYVWVDGENVMEMFGNRANRPKDLYKGLIPEMLDRLELPSDTKAVWSQKAGCSCGCSPGFVLTGSGAYRKDFHVTLEADAPKVTEEGKADAAWRVAQLLSDPTVSGAIAAVAEERLGTGRGDKGNLRNFAQMSDKKFFGVLADVLAEGTDDEAIEAVRAEARKRGA